MEDIVVNAFQDCRPIKDRAEDNFKWCWEHRHEMTVEERRGLWALKLTSEPWELKHMQWLDSKLDKYGTELDRQIRAKQRQAATLQTQIRQKQADAAVRALNRQERAIQLERLHNLPEDDPKEMAAVWNYLRTNPRMKRRLFGE